MKRKESSPACLLAIFACILMFAGTTLAAGPSEKVLYRFKGGSDGAEPYSSLDGFSINGMSTISDRLHRR